MKQVFSIMLLLVSFYSFAHAVEMQEHKKLKLNLDEKKLAAGELQVFVTDYSSNDNGIKKMVVGVLLISSPPSKVWKRLKIWDGQGNPGSALEYYKTKHVIEPFGTKNNARSLIEGKLNVAFFKILYTLDVTFNDKNYLQNWRLVTDEEVDAYQKKNISVNKSSSVLNNIEGYLHLEPYKDGSKTIFYYAPIVSVTIPVPDWIERKISKGILKDFMKGVKRKMENLY